MITILDWFLIQYVPLRGRYATEHLTPTYQKVAYLGQVAFR